MWPSSRPTARCVASDCLRRSTDRSWRRPTSSSAPARCSSTSTQTACTTPCSARRTGSSTTKPSPPFTKKPWSYSNRLEYDQGFFVKGGDGLADVKPIAHLYKGQVYALAEYLGVPAAVRSRPPTTDTYSPPQTQEEFFFALPAAMLDLVLFAHNLGCDPAAVAAELGRTPEEAARALKDVDQKRATTRYLHLPPLLIEP